ARTMSVQSQGLTSDREGAEASEGGRLTSGSGPRCSTNRTWHPTEPPRRPRGPASATQPRGGRLCTDLACGRGPHRGALLGRRPEEQLDARREGAVLA